MNKFFTSCLSRKKEEWGGGGGRVRCKNKHQPQQPTQTAASTNTATSSSINHSNQQQQSPQQPAAAITTATNLSTMFSCLALMELSRFCKSSIWLCFSKTVKDEKGKTELKVELKVELQKRVLHYFVVPCRNSSLTQFTFRRWLAAALALNDFCIFIKPSDVRHLRISRTKCQCIWNWLTRVCVWRHYRPYNTSISS